MKKFDIEVKYPIVELHTVFADSVGEAEDMVMEMFENNEFVGGQIIDSKPEDAEIVKSSESES